MNTARLIVLICSIVVLSACASVPPSEPEAETKVTADSTKPEPALMKVLPANSNSFDLQGFKHFEDGSGGYSIRYANTRKRRIADLYVYPVADENSELGHNQLVLGSTRATLMAIGEAAKQGHYSNFNVINAATRAQGLRTTARVQATYLRKNLASYTLVYQTEHKGTLLKIRINMPDNESNRTSAEWDVFADKLFQTVISDMDKQDASKTKTRSIKL